MLLFIFNLQFLINTSFRYLNFYVAKNYLLFIFLILEVDLHNSHIEVEIYNNNNNNPNYKLFNELI